MENTIYVGKYLKNLRKDGVIELPDSKLRILNMYIGTSDGESIDMVDKRITLVVEDGDFWPYICKMNKEEAEKLRDALDKMIKSSEDYQISEVI